MTGRDACRAQLVALDSTGNFFGEDIMRGAAVGAVGGAVLGGLLAAATGRRGSGVLAGAAIGAAAGGIAGAAAGYYNARQRQATDQASLNRRSPATSRRENAQIDRTQLAFDQLMDCRFGTAQRIRADLSHRPHQPPQAEAQMAAAAHPDPADIQLGAGDQRPDRHARRPSSTPRSRPWPPASSSSVLAARASAAAVPTQARATVPLQLRPDPSAPEVDADQPPASR